MSIAELTTEEMAAKLLQYEKLAHTAGAFWQESGDYRPDGVEPSNTELLLKQISEVATDREAWFYIAELVCLVRDARKCLAGSEYHSADGVLRAVAAVRLPEDRGKTVS